MSSFVRSVIFIGILFIYSRKFSRVKTLLLLIFKSKATGISRGSQWGFSIYG